MILWSIKVWFYLFLKYARDIIHSSLSSYGEENTEVLFGNIEKFDKVL